VACARVQIVAGDSHKCGQGIAPGIGQRGVHPMWRCGVDDRATPASLRPEIASRCARVTERSYPGVVDIRTPAGEFKQGAAMGNRS
jgi:hypothetical protein